MSARCGAGCIQPAAVRAVFRVELTDENPVGMVDIDFCLHHYGRHVEAFKASPNFIIAVVLDEAGNPVTVEEEPAA